MRHRRTRDPMARDLLQPKYRMRVAEDKNIKEERRQGRHAKHKTSPLPEEVDEVEDDADGNRDW